MNDKIHAGNVLIVDDEQSVAELYKRFLDGTYEVTVATNGEAALAVMSDAIDVVLLDRRMPGMSGKVVLNQIRDAGYDCPIVMVTAVTPQIDIIEMGFEEYLTKPVDRTTLLETVQTVLDLSDYDARLQKYYRVASKIAHLEVENPDLELTEHTGFNLLREQRDRLKEELEEAHDTTEGNLRRLLEQPGPHPSADVDRKPR